MKRIVSLLVSLVFAETLLAQTQIHPRVLGQIKDSTVYVKNRVGSDAMAGSGFLFERQGNTGIVVTNAHVVSQGSGSSGQIEVVFSSGTRAERSAEAKIVSLDKDRDLALLRVTSDKLPMPLKRMRGEGLTETMTVYAVGFPFGDGLAAKQGNPEITLSAGTISSFRKDDYGNLVAIQLDGGVNPGNSGGPIIDAHGDLVGIAVAMVSGTQIGLAIPAQSLSEMLLGRVSEVTMSEKSNDKGWIEIECKVRLIDPMNAIQRVSVLYALKDLSGEMPERREDGRFDAIKKAREQVLKIEDQVATGVFRIRTKSDEPINYLQQIKYIRRDRKILYLEPASLTLGKSGTDSVAGKSNGSVVSDVPVPMKPVETAPAAVDTVTKLAAPIEDLAVAGMGRYLACKLKDMPGLTIYDAYQAKIVHTLRLPSTEFLFAAGGDRAVIYLKDENLLQTWEISGGVKLKTKPNPFPQPITSLLMGYARSDQAFATYGEGRSSYSGKSSLIGLDALQPIGDKDPRSGGRMSDLGPGCQMRANHDMSRITSSRMHTSPSGIYVMRKAGLTYDTKYEHESQGVPIPGDDGRVYMTSGRIYTSDLISVGDVQGNTLFPALGGGFYIALNDQGRITIYEAGKTTPLTPWGQFPEWGDKSSETWQKSKWTGDMLNADKHLIFAPNLGRIIIIPLDSSSIILKPFSLKATLDKSGIDYVVVSSIPQTEVKPRQQWKYQIETLSKAGGVKYAIELAPQGMKVSDTGLMTWAIPYSMAESGEKVVVLVTDKSGEQAYHSFTLRLVGRTTGVGSKH